jgi:hypothetical protein
VRGVWQGFLIRNEAGGSRLTISNDRLNSGRHFGGCLDGARMALLIGFMDDAFSGGLNQLWNGARDPLIFYRRPSTLYGGLILVQTQAPSPFNYSAAHGSVLNCLHSTHTYFETRAYLSTTVTIDACYPCRQPIADIDSLIESWPLGDAI